MDHSLFLEQLNARFQSETSDRLAPELLSGRTSEKITTDGQLKPFYGATSVFKLQPGEQDKCKKVQDAVHAGLGSMLVPLLPHTFHLTIHAFCNVYNVSPDTEKIKDSLHALEGRIEEELAHIANKYPQRTIRVQSLGVSGDRSSLGIKFAPCSEEDTEVLTDLFNRFERIYPLGKPYIPHVSLGYFRLGSYDEKEVKQLYDVLETINRGTGFIMNMDINDVAYQHHYHMNDFRDVLGIQSLKNEKAW